MALEEQIRVTIESLGYKNVKEEQKEAIAKFVMEKKDVFICLPTGYGKSLCYYAVPILCDKLLPEGTPRPWSLIIIVSPLVALMKDQVSSLKEKGLNAFALVVDGTEEATSVMNGQYQYIFTTPEILLCSKNWSCVFQSQSFQNRIVGVIIDEAHCVKKWGLDFRKEYSRLGDLRGFFPSHVPMMALTATASFATRKDVVKLLGMRKPHMIIRSPNKENITYSVEKKYDDFDVILKPIVEQINFRRTSMDKTIIFCRTYQDCSAIYYYFKDVLRDGLTDPIGYPDVTKFKIVNMFSACNSATVKNEILSSFSLPNGRLRVVIATIAFGMGIDCPNIRHIIHWGPPSSIESYIQETGRAGRDGLPASAVLYYSNSDLSRPFMESPIVTYCKNTDKCRREVLFRDFDYVESKCVMSCCCCDVCAMVCECEYCQFV